MTLWKHLTFAAAGVMLVVTSWSVLAAEPVSRSWPDRQLAKFVFELLDISSFRNSTGPRRKSGQRHFSDIGIRPDKFTDTVASSDDGGQWFYQVRILGKADYNKDGVQDVAICFSDAATNGGSYRTTNHYVLQLLDGRAVALAFTEDAIAEAGDCRSSR
jgi:hypothetical protein